MKRQAQTLASAARAVATIVLLAGFAVGAQAQQNPSRAQQTLNNNPVLAQALGQMLQTLGQAIATQAEPQGAGGQPAALPQNAPQYPQTTQPLRRGTQGVQLSNQR